MKIDVVRQPSPSPTQLSPEQVTEFREEGFLAFADVLTANEIEEATAALSELIHSLSWSSSEIRSAERHHNIYSAKGRMYMQLEPGLDPRTLSADEVELKVRKLMNYHDQHPLLHRLATAHARVMGIITSLLGPNPILFQDMALIKPPWIGSEKPWHQDDAYFSVLPLDAIVGVWIALDDALVENGCMHVIPRGHKLGPLRHFHGRDCEVAEGQIDPADAVPVELPAGGAMFFQGLLPHETPPNQSSLRRRALQFHYRSATSRVVSRNEYDKAFADRNGQPASCAATKGK